MNRTVTCITTLKLLGVISCLDSDYPSDDDMESLRRINLMEDNVWDPFSSLFAEQEAAIEARMNDDIDEFMDKRRIVSAEIAIGCRDNILYERLISSVGVP